MARPETPLLTVDIIIEMVDRPRQTVVLIERAHEPLGWALPGGFVDIGESLEQAAVREAREETGLDIELVDLLGCYSNPERDARGHTASAVFIAQARGEPKAQDDAKSTGLFDPDHCPPLVFDHALIMKDYRRYRRTGARTPLRYEPRT